MTKDELKVKWHQCNPALLEYEDIDELIDDAYEIGRQDVLSSATTITSTEGKEQLTLIASDNWHCMKCGRELIGIQHPMKPLGVCITSFCPKCEPRPVP